VGTRNAPGLSVDLGLDTNQRFELGTSGGAVVNEQGELVAIISFGGGNQMGCTRPNMALPVWVYRRFFIEEPELTEKHINQFEQRIRCVLKYKNQPPW